MSQSKYTINTKYAEFLTQEQYDLLDGTSQMIIKMLLSSTAKIEQKKDSVLALLAQNSIVVKAKEQDVQIHEMKNKIQDLEKNKGKNKARSRGQRFNFSVNMRRSLFFILQLIKDNEQYLSSDPNSNFGTEEDPMTRDEFYAQNLFLCDSKGEDQLTQDQLNLMWRIDRPHVEYNRGFIEIKGNMRSLFHDYIVVRQSNDSPLYNYSENTKQRTKRRNDGSLKETTTNSEFHVGQGMALFSSDWNATSTNAMGRGMLAFGIAIKIVTESRYVELLTKDNPDRADGLYSRKCIKFMELSTANHDDYQHQNIKFNMEFSELLANWLIEDKQRTLSMLEDQDIFNEFKNAVIAIGDKMNG